jgi:hypothetical protein
MRYAILCVAAIVLTVISTIVSPVEVSEDALWSKPDNGVQARLLVLPGKKPNEPFCRVYLEFQNVSDVMGQTKIRFSPGNLTLAVTNKNGRKLATPSSINYDGPFPLWESNLPYDGTLKFRISLTGLGYRPGKDKVIIDVGTNNVWVVPQNSSTYYLSGTLSIKKEKGDHPHTDWSGTLTLPKVEIPKENTEKINNAARKPENLAMSLAQIAERLHSDLDAGLLPHWRGAYAFVQRGNAKVQRFLQILRDYFCLGAFRLKA